MKKFNFILGIILMALGFACLVVGGIGQMCYRYVPAPTDWFFLGVVPITTGWIMLYRGD